MIGIALVRAKPDSGGEPLIARIVETEAYLPGDAASHAFAGRTARNATMFGERGFAYVYFIYGNHYCVNVTSETAGVGAAVLIRAAEPIAGHALMVAERGERVAARDLLRGPGRLTRALRIDRTHDGVDLCGSREIWLAQAPQNEPMTIVTGPRIGITKNADAPLRFYAAGNRFVSRTNLQDSAFRARL